MNALPKRMDVQHATDDLRRRTLANMGRPLDRLIYLASTRDYNTGVYYHDGLAARFTEEVACEALADCHREAFRELVVAPLKELVSQLDGYIDSTHTEPQDFIAAWKKLEPYRVAIPVNADELSADFLFSNLKIALAVLQARLGNHPRGAPDALQLPSPGR
jgi:hypothetical protein